MDFSLYFIENIPVLIGADETFTLSLINVKLGYEGTTDYFYLEIFYNEAELDISVIEIPGIEIE